MFQKYVLLILSKILWRKIFKLISLKYLKAFCTLVYEDIKLKKNQTKNNTYN